MPKFFILPLLLYGALLSTIQAYPSTIEEYKYLDRDVSRLECPIHLCTEICFSVCQSRCPSVGQLVGVSASSKGIHCATGNSHFTLQITGTRQKKLGGLQRHHWIRGNSKDVPRRQKIEDDLTIVISVIL